MDFSLCNVDDVSDQGDSASQAVACEVNKDKITNDNKDRNEVVSLIPRETNATTQPSKNLERENTMTSSPISNGKTGSGSSRSNIAKCTIAHKRKTNKPDHKSLLDQRSEIQYLIDFKNTRIELQPFPYATFSKHREKMEIYKLITLDGEPITKLVLCTKCRKLLVRYKPSATNLVRHFERHEKKEEPDRISSKDETIINLKERCKQSPPFDRSAGKMGPNDALIKGKISKEVGDKISPKSEANARRIQITNYSERSIGKGKHMPVSYLGSNAGEGGNGQESQGHQERTIERAEILSSKESQERPKSPNKKKPCTERSFESSTSHRIEAISEDGRSILTLGSEETPITIE